MTDATTFDARVYQTEVCVVGQDELAKRRISEALRED
jgi:hypothetical protein